MAKLCLLVIFIISIQQILANNYYCSDVENVEKIMSCNDCIRCGGHWCNDPNERTRCKLAVHDSWCPSAREQKAVLPQVKEPGKELTLKYVERTLHVRQENKLAVYSGSAKPEVQVELVNATQNGEVFTKTETFCKDGKCTTYLTVSPSYNFCSATGRTTEVVNVKLNVVDVAEEMTAKYHVPCACQCAETVEQRSPKCNFHGNYSCGVCTCDDKWTGKYCEKAVCGEKRGDVQCTDTTRNDVECYGNGVCGPCEICECYTDRIGSRYFEQETYCADICVTTSNCDSCLRNPLPGMCQDCHFPFIFQPFNKTFMAEKDSLSRDIWITCNVTLPDSCQVKYAAMRDDSKDTYFMVISDSCDPENAAIGGGSVNVTLPIVLGVIAIVTALAATAGYIMWKNRPPALPFTDSMYHNIGGPESTGENPLYKPPTSSFKNPTYGKW